MNKVKSFFESKRFNVFMLITWIWCFVLHLYFSFSDTPEIINYTFAVISPIFIYNHYRNLTKEEIDG